MAMAECYEIKDVSGKDQGCVALREIKPGTMILQEKPQMFLPAGELSIHNLVISFKEMTDFEDEEFLKLHNRFTNFEELTDLDKAKVNDWKHDLEENMKCNKEEGEAILDVIGIYITNCFDNGVGIKMSRFNHSCRSNAEYRWNEKTDSREIRAVSKIHTGDEITVNYAWDHSMDNFETRQKNLLNWGFECLCDRCNEEKLDCDAELYMKFDGIKKEAKKIVDIKGFSIEKVMKELNCYEELYKIAKGKKASWSFLIDSILDDGFNASVQGYLCAKKYLDSIENDNTREKELHHEEKSKMEEYLRIFRNKCEMFTTAAEKIAKIVLGIDNIKYLIWKEKKTDLDGWILNAIEKGQFAYR